MARLRVTSALLAAVLAAAAPGSGVVHAANAPAKAARKSVLPFIADDLPRALAEAKSRDLPLFIESWAPW
jgi:hypothetical protein